ncbi:glycoside hydrolase family 18 protein [Nocardioides plantarum]|uniref:Glycoside hydrolase family 18 protein n=1 Tax=Nocardioides plantarum TaxID=29299 RepID=A0ABV5KCV1_9ACTN|nr:glycoside hydrolase family 18 protein [Nocardioides plantarum]
MSDLPPPPPSGPPPSGPPPSGPPPAGPPPAGPPAAGPSAAGGPTSGRSKAPWIVGLALVAVLAVVVVLVVTLTGSKAAEDARSVQDVADIAVDAAQDLDVDAGVDLLCEAPGASDRDQLESLIDEARDRAGTDDPDVDYEISDVEGDKSGSFRVHVTSDEQGLEDQELDFVVRVDVRGERSCIAGLQPE